MLITISRTSRNVNVARRGVNRPVAGDDGDMADETSVPPVIVPRAVYQQLKAGFAARSAEQITRRLLRHPAHEPRLAHPGDPFGTVFAWMWADDQDQAMIFLADVLAGLRNFNEIADIDPPVTLDELLRWTRLALPHGFTGYEQVVATARREVPGYYGSDPNSVGTWEDRHQ
jgi:hypothetical protein